MKNKIQHHNLHGEHIADLAHRTQRGAGDTEKLTVTDE